VLWQIHDDLDAAVFAAYGWPVTLTDDEILQRLVALNAERAAEEAAGLVRWLRPEFQNPALRGKQQRSLALLDDEAEGDQPAAKPRKKKSPAAKAAEGKAEKSAKRDWPKGRAAQAKAVLAALRDGPATATELAERFTRAPAKTVDELLQAIVTLGLARRGREGKYAC
jgi:hypothetical protein